MTSFKITPHAFEINGRETYLLMGEIHYFRMPPEGWRPALERLKECGCNAVAYYVPWFVHQPQEDTFDFEGQLHPQNNLRAWLRLTQEVGLIGFARLGPYVYAETTDLGIPRWFSSAHPEARVQDWRGGAYVEATRVGCVAHRNPAFLAAVERWYAAVAAEIRPFLAPEGNIAMVQLCNEIPCDDNDDQNPVNLGIGREDGLYPAYLKKMYGTAAALNARYGTHFSSLMEVEPRHLREADPDEYQQERLRYYYEFYYPGYFATLRAMLAAHGVEAVFAHNAYNPRAISLHTENCRQNPWLQIGLDCYYSMTGSLGLTAGTYFCEYGCEYLRRFLHRVPWVAEQECGYWNDYPRVYGPEVYLWNLWMFAAGYQGVNMYLFASGVNRPGMGFYGTDHGWQAPLDELGRPRRNYEDIRRSLRDIRRNEEVLRQEHAYDVCMGIMDQPGLIWKPLARHSNETYFSLRRAGYLPRLVDVVHDELSPQDTLVLASDDRMDVAVQQKLIDFVQEGGRLVLMGLLPLHTSQGERCQLLPAALGMIASEGALEMREQEKLVWDGKEYSLGTAVQSVAAAPESVMAWTPDGRPAILEANVGRGRAMVLPFGIQNTFCSTAQLMERVLRRLQTPPTVEGAQELAVIPKADGHTLVLNPAPVAVTEHLLIRGKPVDVSMEPYAFAVL